MNRVAALIPTRAGSKGLPDKCMAELGGYTLIHHAVRQALRTCGTAYVITDSEEHALEAQAAGARTVVQDFPVPDGAVPEQQEHRAIWETYPELFQEAETFVRLFVTHPLRADWDIIRAVNLHQETERTVVTATEADHREHQVMQPMVTTASSSWVMQSSDPKRPRQQVAPPETYLVGCAYVASRRDYRAHAFWPPEGFAISLMPRIRTLDVDTPRDLELMRKLWPIRHELAGLK